MKHIDDDRDFILPNPAFDFLGYRCPWNQCVFIQEDHDWCYTIVMRLKTQVGEPAPFDDWLETFKFNWNAWLLKTGNQTFSRAS